MLAVPHLLVFQAPENNLSNYHFQYFSRNSNGLWFLAPPDPLHPLPHLPQPFVVGALFAFPSVQKYIPPSSDFCADGTEEASAVFPGMAEGF